MFPFLLNHWQQQNHNMTCTGNMPLIPNVLLLAVYLSSVLSWTEFTADRRNYQGKKNSNARQIAAIRLVTGTQSITPGGVNYNPRSLRARRGGASRRGAVVILEPQRELHYTQFRHSPLTYNVLINTDHLRNSLLSRVVPHICCAKYIILFCFMAKVNSCAEPA